MVLACSQVSICSSLLYIRYKDHVFFKNYTLPSAKVIERETVGWVKEQNEEMLLLVSDRAVSVGDCKVNGVVILKSCIVEMVELPLKQALNCSKTTRKVSMRSAQRSEKLTEREKK